MSPWDIFRWRTLAGGPPCRQRRQRFSHRAFLSPRPKRVPPFGISDGGGTRRCASALNSRRVAARDNSRFGAVSYAHACANHWRTCAAGDGVKFPASCLQPPFWGSLEEAGAPPSKKNKSAKRGSPRAPLFCGLLWGDLRGLAFSNFFLRSP